MTLEATLTVAGALVARVDVPGAASASDEAARSARRARGREVLRGLAAQLAGVPASDVVVEARCPDCGGPHGRPVVMGPSAARDVRVTLAHAGTSIVVAAIVGRSLGVDAERRGQGEAEDARDTAIRALAPGGGTDPLLHWTRIESVLKADGRGLRVDPGQVYSERRGASQVFAVPGDERRYEVHRIELGDDLVVSLAIEA